MSGQYERQVLDGRYSDTKRVEAVLEDIFPRHKYLGFFNTHPRKFDVHVRYHYRASDRRGFSLFETLTTVTAHERTC
jgi:hypothetical protein